MTPSSLLIEPIHVPIRQAPQITGESVRSLYSAVERGELTAVKAGARTMLIYAELKQRCASRPRGLPKESPHLAEARRKKRTEAARRRSKKRRGA
jgi:hypothetical protein